MTGLFLEAIAHRIGGPDHNPVGRVISRVFGPDTIELDPSSDGNCQLFLQNPEMPDWGVYVTLDDCKPGGDDHWRTGQMSLEDFNGHQLGTPRPFALYLHPHDVPCYTLFENLHGEGAFSVGLRVTEQDNEQTPPALDL